MGDVVENGAILAGARNDDGTGFAGTEDWLLQHSQRQRDIFSGKLVGENTVIGCVVTNAALTKAQAAKLAAVAQNGIARAVARPTPPLTGTASSPCAAAPFRRTPTPWASWPPGRWRRPSAGGSGPREGLHGRPALRDLPFAQENVNPSGKEDAMQTVSALPYTRMSIEDFGRQIQAVIQQVKEAASPRRSWPPGTSATSW